jgi:integrase
VKRALTKQALQHMYRLKLTKPRLALARDMFLLSYYMHGMSFIDMAYLKPTNIYKGMLSYKRHKTGQIVELRWEQQMQEIVERYPNSSGLYLLPFITKQNDKERNQYRHYQFVVNHNLKEIGQEIGLEVPLTMYMARHTWATLAHDMDIPLSVISRAMGHTSEKTTEIYIRSVDRNTIDQANVRLINSVVGNSNGHYIE